MLDARGVLKFFDTPAVAKDMDRKQRKKLSRFGAFTRRRAKSSIRRRKASAPAGSPPSDHGGPLKKLIFFAWDTARKAVVIGPLPFNEGTAPHALEYGGTSTMRQGRTRAAHVYEARPFMGPAYDAELQGLDKLLAAD